MIVARSLGEWDASRPSVVTVGTFDGVHAGHRSILTELLSRGAKSGMRSVVVTFTPHPRTVVGRGPVGLLTTLDERLDLLRNAGVDATYIVHFTYEFSRQSPVEFFDATIVPLGTRAMIFGHDHLFGRDRQAGIDQLRKLALERGIDTEVLDPVTIEGGIVSSSAIRAHLATGDVEAAGRLLARAYSVRGTVVRGDGRGASLGFATANLVPGDPEKIIPANGVYIVEATVRGSRWGGMMNIGVRPTFSDAAARILEVHLFGLSGSLYGEGMEVRFLRRMRDEKRFASVDELRAQLKSDAATAQEYLRLHSYSTV